MFVLLSKAYSLNICKAALFYFEGVTYTPNIRNLAVVSIRGMVITVFRAPSDVIFMSPGVEAIFCRWALPPAQFQERRNQKDFDRFKALPVLYSSFSQDWARILRLDISSLRLALVVMLVPSPESSTKASPTYVIGWDWLTELRWIAGVVVLRE